MPTEGLNMSFLRFTCKYQELQTCKSATKAVKVGTIIPVEREQSSPRVFDLYIGHLDLFGGHYTGPNRILSDR